MVDHPPAARPADADPAARCAELWARLQDLRAQARRCEDELREARAARRAACAHAWERDLSVRDDRTRYECRRCGATR